MTDIYQLKPVRGYWNKYVLPRLPLRKRNKIDTEEQLRFEKLQRELCRIINEITDDNLDATYFRISVACKRRNEKLYIRILYDYRWWWSVTSYMIDLHKRLYKSEYLSTDNERVNEWASVENSDFYNKDIQKMLMEFIEYSEQKLVDPPH